MSQTDELSADKQIKLLEEWVNQPLSVKKQILNQLLAQDQQALELYVAAHDIHVVIKDNRMVTQKKLLAGLTQWARSEERRVGKECRSRWSAEHEEKRQR